MPAAVTYWTVSAAAAGVEGDILLLGLGRGEGGTRRIYMCIDTIKHLWTLLWTLLWRWQA